MDMVIDIEGLNKTFGKNQVLKNINLKIQTGEMVGLIGASGSGKSTLIRSIAGLETMDHTSKHIKIFSEPTQLGHRRTSSYRSLRKDVGIIFQQFNLVGRLSLLTNVLIGRLAHNPSWKGIFKLFPKAERIKALQALERVNMVDYAHQRSSTLSGGQQQRGAIARALTQEAKLILADEPIASLDPASSDRVMNLLCDINNQDGTTVVVSLHQFEVATTRCDRIIALRDGEIVYDGKACGISNADLIELYGVEEGICNLGAERPTPIMKAG
ncbi:phosphonate transport system ATP-binding protein [Desulfuromusa kysingii]|uniref:Phosphonate transport system ATP-binding protein n=1 Tax=Desulfuromusa kysingii TaxID=37625 RepID=A0A1H3ZVI7_9BACT|nr:phosphonate ABC transporter ATP-binding protein [Desulfuromusa kysingii]SEA27689.1 phosphonate transport system ATP-binding protein [Desulfuromusa kysingii]